MEFVEAASNGFAIAAKEFGDVTDASVSELAGLDRSVDAAIPFGQRMKDVLHGLLDVERVGNDHGGILPGVPALLCRCRKLP